MTASRLRTIVPAVYAIVVILAAFLLDGAAFVVVVVVGAIAVGAFYSSGLGRPAARDRQRTR